MQSERAYVVGDIHGHLDKLIAVHELIAKDQQSYGAAKIVHLGDLVDRGPNSKGVIAYLMDGIEAGLDWVVLKGNHDRMMSWYLERASRRDHVLRVQYEWLHPRLGGWETLESYGLTSVTTDLTDPEMVHRTARALVPQSHRQFLEALPLHFETRHCFIVHAGVRPGLSLKAQAEDDLIWIREPFHQSQERFAKLIVHGHTPVEQVTHYGNRVNLDTGAAYGGPLSAIVIEGDEVYTLTERGRIKLCPQN